MPRLVFTLTSLLLLLQSADALAGFCGKWDEPKKVGELDKKKLPEASGVAASNKFPGRVYWINDSGSKPILYFSQLDGKNHGKVIFDIAGLADAESLTVAACGKETCLVVGDTGDNHRRRKHVTISVFKESSLKDGAKIKPDRQFKMKYPDGPHDVEAMAALPTGELIFISKEVSLSEAAQAKVFTLSKELWWENELPKEALVPVESGRLPISTWLEGRAFLAVAVTDAAVNAKRGVLGVLTYAALIEIPLAKMADLKDTGNWVKDQDYTLVPIKNLNQQETLAYLTEPDRALWSSEVNTPEPAPIYTLKCLDGDK